MNGLKHGQGKMNMTDGMIYDGTWEEGIIKGYGEIKWSSGNIYKGEFSDNKINGNGYLIWYDTSEKYIGQWTDSLQNGLGIHIWYESKGEQKYLRNRYVGEWRSGFRHGFGVFFYSNGSKYEGTWDQNYKHGYGVFTFHDGSQYTGKFHNDRMIDYNPSGIYLPSGKLVETNRNISSAASTNQGQQRKLTSRKDFILENDEKDKEKANISYSKNFNDKERLKGTIVNKLEEIPENNEVILKNAPNNTMSVPGSVVSNRAALSKEAELNQFKTLLDITDLIELEPDIESSLKEIENILLRHLTEMKSWYKLYTSKESSKDDGNFISANASQTMENNINKTNINFPIREESASTDNMKIVNLPIINNSLDGFNSNNDIGFCMELKDFWKFIRESLILSSDCSLANFDRIFFKGSKNYIEMYLCPEELENKNYYDYIYTMINKSKEEFYIKHRSHFEKKKKNTEDVTIQNKIQQQLQNSLNFTANEIEIDFDIHNKHQIILLRQFYEAIVRLAYLKYFHLNQPLHIKLLYLIENILKQNINLKKGIIKKSNTFTGITDSSMNLSILDMKVKNIEISMDNFIIQHEKNLKSTFKMLYNKCTINAKKYDMTVTYRQFYQKLVLNSNILKEIMEDKFKFVEIINLYHKDKITILADNRKSIEVYSYIENLMESEFIFYEFCEMMFYICKKCSLKNPEKNSNIEILKHLQCLMEGEKAFHEINFKNQYTYPKLENHRQYERIIQIKRQKEDEENRKKLELMRVELEKKLMMIEDQNVLPEKTGEEDEDEAFESEEDY